MDADLVLRAQRGDRQAFEALTVAVHPRLFRVAHGILRDPTLAEDATQQALIDIWRYLRKLRDPARFEAWAYRLVVNVCGDEFRQRTRSLSGALSSSAEPVSPDPFGVVVDREQLSRAFGRLSVDHRAVIVLRFLLDLSVDDTALALDVPRGTVASRQARALLSLRAALDADDRGGVPSRLGGEVAR